MFYDVKPVLASWDQKSTTRTYRFMANYTAPAAACAADMLMLLGGSERPLSLAEIARAVDSSKSLVFRVAKELEARDLIQESSEGRFWLGVETLELGGAYTSQSDYAESARKVLHRLSHETGETVNLGTLRGADLLYLAKWEGANSVVTVSHVGKSIPANCTAMGKALLAQLTKEEVAERFNGSYPTLTGASLGSYGDLVKDLESIQERGYAIDESETLNGRACIAMVLDTSLLSVEGPVAISIAMTTPRFDQKRDEFVRSMTNAVERLDSEWRKRMTMAGSGHEQ